jgi:hypothetical protein
MDVPNGIACNVNLFLSTSGTGRRIIALKAKNIAFSQGEAADSVFFLQAGRAELTVVSKSGKEATVTHLVAGEGLSWAIERTPESSLLILSSRFSMNSQRIALALGHSLRGMGRPSP